MTSEAPAPGIELLEAFVNTNDVEGGRDALATPRQLGEWLAERGLAEAGGVPDPAAHRRVLDVREGIRALARANNQEPLNEPLLTAMNRAAKAAPLTVSIQPGTEGGWRLVPASDGADAFVARMLATVAQAMADGSWSRVKACRNDTCRWLFYDQSRNRSGTWCTMAVCGSRMKARAYRARRREATSA